jgi:hypothetical protein
MVVCPFVLFLLVVMLSGFVVLVTLLVSSSSSYESGTMIKVNYIYLERHRKKDKTSNWYW